MQPGGPDPAQAGGPASAAAPLIDISSIRFCWPRSPHDCLNVSRFSIDRGERVFLFGPSGVGKSTFLGLLGGVQVPQTGVVRVLGSELSAMGATARDRFRVEHIGFIFQQFNLVPYLSVVENVLLPCCFSPGRAARAIATDGSARGAALRLLETMRLGPGLHGRVATALSVGQQQRVAVARALIGQPELIIADEPTSALDENVQDAFLDLLLRECERAGSTLLFVSHNRRLAAHFHREVNLAEINRAAPAESSQ